MKRILGLDLGSTSIGWAVIEEFSQEILSESQDSQQDNIVALGSRIIPLTTDESTQFTKGQALTKNADRTKSRTQRKGYDRYQLRRKLLLEQLAKLGMYNGQALHLSKLELWGLRAKAADEQISLLELGRVLCHINQKRGYKTAKSDFGDKQKGEYVTSVVNRYRELHETGQTIGQYMYANLTADPAFRCKERVYPRDAYIEEFDAIMARQSTFYPELLTDEVVQHIRDYIIFHQRPLKSCKHLIGRCELERCDVVVDGRVYNRGPKVAPRSSPLFQLCKIWEAVNNITITNKNDHKEKLYITLEQKQSIVSFMSTHDKLKAADLKKILGIVSRDWPLGKVVGAGLQGNTTYCAIAKALGGDSKYAHLLDFNVHIVDSTRVDTETGEVLPIIAADFEHQPLYRLWHTLYSLSDISELEHTLRNNFGITDSQVIEALCHIDFVKSGYSNKSSRAMRKILPHLMAGAQYYDAKLAAGYDDTTLTNEQNESRELAAALQPIPKGALRQPVVEKILGQLVNLVNALMEEYGRFDEIRVELARELKQSREERESTEKNIRTNNKKNDQIATRIASDFGLTPTRSRIQKYKMWEESNHTCIYCGKTVGVVDFLQGFGVEVEHIIPRSVLFDDSFTNKVCACRECNQQKGNRTAYDFVASRGEGELQAYIERINTLADKKAISHSKLVKLMMRGDQIPTDFIERQLRESQYIAKKARQMLSTVCRNVYATSGSITDFIRHIWGWDEVLHRLNIDRYRTAGLTEMIDREVEGVVIPVERITGWSKRMDHRHHAIDALTIACTKQGYIQRINNLNSLKEVAFRPLTHQEQGEATGQRLTRLERYIAMQPHFTTAEVEKAVAGIVVSFKSGKRAASIGKRYIRKGGKRICVQRGIIIPRGALCEESVYGQIVSSQSGKSEIVIKYKVGTIDIKKVESVVDHRIREILRARLMLHNGNPDKAFAEPVLDHQGNVIHSVRCYTGLNSTVPVRYNERGEAIAFVKPGNNHHVAIYEDENGVLQEHIVTFWHAVERKKYSIPTIITNCAAAWELVCEDMPHSFIEQLPPSAHWTFRFSMQQNEMFILGMDEELYQDAMTHKDYALLSKYLYRVQKLTSGIYHFRHHLETTVDDKYNGVKSESTSINIGKLIRTASLGSLIALNPHKVHISVTGKISEI